MRAAVPRRRPALLASEPLSGECLWSERDRSRSGPCRLPRGSPGGAAARPGAAVPAACDAAAGGADDDDHRDPAVGGRTRLERRGIPRPVGALLTLLGGVAVLAAMLALIIPTFVDQTNAFVDQVPGIVNDLEIDRRRHHRRPAVARSATRSRTTCAAYTDEPEAADRADHLDRRERCRRPWRPRRDDHHRLLHGGAPAAAGRRRAAARATCPPASHARW